MWAEELERWLPHLRPSQVRDSFHFAMQPSPGSSLLTPCTSHSLSCQIHVIEGRADCLINQEGSPPLPQVTITSYEMTKRLTCHTCTASSLYTSYETLKSQIQRGELAGRCSSLSPCSYIRDFYHRPAPCAVRLPDAPPAHLKQPCEYPTRCLASMPFGMVISDESHNLRLGIP